MLNAALKQMIKQYMEQNQIELTPAQVEQALQGVVYATQQTINDSIPIAVSLALESPSVSNTSNAEGDQSSPDDNQPKIGANTTIEVHTPKGLICANSVLEENYPGLKVTVNGEDLVAVEYDSDRNQHVIRVWKQGQEEPAYVQSVEDFWIKTDHYQYVRVDSPTVFTVIDITELPPEIADHIDEKYILRMMTVDLEEYSAEQVTDILKSYGYELLPLSKEVVIENTFESVESTTIDNNRIIAECIAETYIASESELTLRFKDQPELNQYLAAHQIDSYE
ncbi:hypothetical protein OM416_20400 [Paenibacillus sp. LS1]|uniref:hypothetical protein n=1 Tax=Paenibacillus sp. LS1 TaxID=2992120 RepID=UPI00222F6FCA|nr:hypothetical protein [Paenibacillus sp. LS1]MCW3793959.1 hypothetical protein [Paenibacillus sp. LS1]